MVRIRGQHYKPGKPLCARKPFRVQGRSYKRGQRFDPTKLALDERKLTKLWNAGYLMHPDVQPKARKKRKQSGGGGGGAPAEQTQPTANRLSYQGSMSWA